MVLPLITIFAVGILEYGNVFWQRQHLQAGVRDAARYWSRCRPDFSSCSIAVARNIAFFGNPEGSGYLRVANWYRDTDLVIEPATPPTNPGPADVVRVTGSLDYAGSPMFRFLSLHGIQVTYVHEERYVGW